MLFQVDSASIRCMSPTIKTRYENRGFIAITEFQKRKPWDDSQRYFERKVKLNTLTKYQRIDAEHVMCV